MAETEAGIRARSPQPDGRQPRRRGLISRRARAMGTLLTAGAIALSPGVAGYDSAAGALAVPTSQSITFRGDPTYLLRRPPLVEQQATLTPEQIRTDVSGMAQEIIKFYVNHDPSKQGGEQYYNINLTQVEVDGVLKTSLVLSQLNYPNVNSDTTLSNMSLQLPASAYDKLHNLLGDNPSNNPAKIRSLAASAESVVVTLGGSNGKDSDYSIEKNSGNRWSFTTNQGSNALTEGNLGKFHSTVDATLKRFAALASQN